MKELELNHIAFRDRMIDSRKLPSSTTSLYITINLTGETKRTLEGVGIAPKVVPMNRILPCYKAQLLQ
ncbi:hypothetical protein CM19_04670 [Candidatus Acidianus copahuensis]|uniref:Uncharacterized protein n=1 Tax=Candidatus Acidianus copahuensis TaxID=1160895 RepID=A0A031LQN2_9CREN|nr:hypothetical protein [Candidatus Acidianus copahuensis]EZQ10055.1 hypothetical protein CM19_04670 [Candidatus Acidianus copahuensis]